MENISLRIIITLALAAVSFIVAGALTPVLTNILYRYKLGKNIRTGNESPIFQQLHAKKAGTPTMGGILIWGTAILLAGLFWLLATLWPDNEILKLFNFVNRRETFLPLAALLFAALVGLADDLRGIFKQGEKGGGLSMRTRLLLYTAVAAVGAWWFVVKLDYTALYVPFLGLVDIGLWYIPFFLFIIVASAFSTNETDGLDGLAGGVMLIAFSAFGAIALSQGRFFLATFTAVIIGALLAFLWFNVHPARFFMGDTGSMALGITAGLVALLTQSALFLPFIMFVPVVESLSVIIQLLSKRIRHKKVFLSAPIHHHFEAIGWPETKVTMRFWILNGVAAAVGLALLFVSYQVAPLP